MQRSTRSLFLLICSLFIGFAAGAQVTANFTANNLSGCAPLVVQFTSTSTGNINSYSWNLGNTVTSTLQNPSTTYTTPGTYTVTLTVSGPGGTNTKTVNSYITVYPQPTVAFTANNLASCPPLTVQFTNSSVPNAPGGMTYSWDFGDGNSSTVANPSHTYYVPGLYSPTLVVTNSSGCSKTLVKANYLEVYAPPNGDFSASAYNFCDAPATVTFTNTSTGSTPYTTTWDFGDGNNGAGNTTNHTYAAAGSYTVTMVVTGAHGCKDTVIKPQVINVGASAATFTSVSSACPWVPILFTNTTTGLSSANWDFGDGSPIVSTTTNTTHTYVAGGTYNVRLITQNAAGCIDTVVHTITIYPQPNMAFVGVPDTPCPAPSPVQFTNLTTGATSYAWSFGDGGTSSQTNPNHLYTYNWFHTVTLIATSAQGCADTLVKNEYIRQHNMILNAGASPNAGCVPLTTVFSSSLMTDSPTAYIAPWYAPIVYPSPIVSYLWTFGDATPNSTQATPTHTYTSPGTYLATLTVTTHNGCTKTDTVEIHVGTKPTAAFTLSPSVICPHGTVYFTNQSTNATNYGWDLGEGYTSSSVNPSQSYLIPGLHTVILTASNNGCPDTISHTFTVNPSNATFKDSIYCPPSKTVKFTNTSVQPTWWEWYFGDGDTSTLMNPVHTYPSYGTYNVTLVTYNSVYGCRDTLVRAITLFVPQLSFVANDTAICLNDTFHLTSSYSGNPASYSWRLDNQLLLDTLSSIDYSFHTTGFHTVTLLVYSQLGCLDTVRKTNYILVAKPDAGFSASVLQGCIPVNVVFTDTTHYTVGTWAVNRDWDFGDGGTANNNNTTSSHPYTTPGQFDVQLIVTDNVGCKDTLLKPVNIDARHPTASFYANDTGACLNQVISFSNASLGASNLTYVWDFGDGSPTSTAANPNHAYTTPGSYTVRLIITDNVGCKDTMTRTGYMNVTKPNASFNLSDTLAVCPPLLVHFTNTSTGAINYTWDFGNGNPSYIANPVNTFSTPGNFNIQLIAVDGNGCADTATANVKVLGYAGALSYTPLIGCAPLQVNFTASVINVPNLVWDFSDGVTSNATGATISHIYLTPGAYVPKLLFSDGQGCINSSTGLDTIKVDGVYAGFIVNPPCEMTDVEFKDTSKSLFSAIVYSSWTFDAGTGIGSPVTHYYGAPGTYPVTLISVNGNGCRDTVTRNVTIYPLPVITATGDTAICPGDPAPLLAAGGVSYTWAPGTTLSCVNCPNPVATTNVPSIYVATGTDVHGCSNRDTVHVNIQSKTSADVGGDREICLGESIGILAYGAQVYQWYPATALSNSQIGNPLASPTATTNYMVVSKEGSCPADTDFVKVIVHPLPTVNAGADQTVVAGGSVSLQASGSGVQHYTWEADPTLSCTACSNPTATPQHTTTYKVVAYTSYGCTDTDMVDVRVLCDQSQVFIPNTFTPNGDGQNDFFFPRGVGIDKITSFRIYNRWGQLMYEKSGMAINDERSGWDGTYKGKELAPDVYVYVVDAVCQTGAPVSWKGDVTLIR